MTGVPSGTPDASAPAAETVPTCVPVATTSEQRPRSHPEPLEHVGGPAQLDEVVAGLEHVAVSLGTAVPGQPGRDVVGLVRDLPAPLAARPAGSSHTTLGSAQLSCIR